MLEIIFQSLEFIRQELLLFCVIIFIIGGLDDIIIDILWIYRWCKRKITIYRDIKPMQSHQLSRPLTHILDHSILENEKLYTEGIHAIFVPTWQESLVIGDMLDGCYKAWSEAGFEHRIYVGCYPNDDKTIAAVINAARNNPNITIVLCENDGPTTKADCLNNLWKALLRDELNMSIKTKSIILHDAEDSPHPDALAIFDYLIAKNDLVQLPVIPVAVKGSPFVSGHYCDEFCESHAKGMVVREALGASLPLAGVGCAIDRNCLGRLALGKKNLPFDAESITEDYEMGLNIGSTGKGAIMVRMKDRNGNLVGTRSCFPNTMKAAIKQKSRWTLGIALSGWDRVGWKSSLSPFHENVGTHNNTIGLLKKPKWKNASIWIENWMRFRDRREIISAITICFAYITFLLSLVLMLTQFADIFQAQPVSKLMSSLILLTSFMLLWRFMMRTAFSYYHYGFGAALLALPRMLVSNVIAIVAARKAIALYVRNCLGEELKWEKTEHFHIPKSEILVPDSPVIRASAYNKSIGK